jgi:hypothetical protein
MVLLLVGLIAGQAGIGSAAYFTDDEPNAGNTFEAWVSSQWVQTTQGDFQAGVLNNVDISSSPGDVMLDATSDSVTDTFNDETMIASKSNLVVAGGQVKLTSGAAPGTETLRPNASGTYTQCAGFGDSPNYRCVDDVTPDENATYVWPGMFGLRIDTYATEDSSVGTGIINSVTLYFRARLAGSCPTHTANTQLLTHSTLYAGTSETLTGSYADYSTVYTTNPNTGSAWTWTEVNDMEIGIGITGCSPGNEPFVTQVWAVVDYSGGAPSTDITFEVRASDTLSGGFPDTAWIPVGGTSPVTSGLPSGRYMQWRATLTTSDPSETPVLHEVTLEYY